MSVMAAAEARTYDNHFHSHSFGGLIVGKLIKQLIKDDDQIKTRPINQ